MLEEELEKFEVSDNCLDDEDEMDMNDDEDVSERVIDQFELVIKCYTACKPLFKQ